jgi:prephenate dehydrogenase
MEWADKHLPQGVDFIGGHPMAGKEVSGIEAAEASILKGCTYCLVPGNNVSYSSVLKVDNLVKQIGAKSLVLTAQEHDKYVAGISHLPLLLSVALVSTTTKSSSWVKMSELAATGFRDLTRLASQDPTMDHDICLTNQKNIISWIDDFISELEQIRNIITTGGTELEELFIRTRQARQRWLEEYDKKD